MNLAALLKQSCPVTVLFGGETLKVAYRPNLIDGHMLVRLRTASPGTELEATAQLLLELITEWDMNDDGTPVPLSKEALMSLPATLLDGLGREIMTSFSEGKVTTPSANGSSVTAA